MAYVFQGAYLFLAFYWAAKYCFFFMTFSSLMVPQNAPYQFVPKNADPRGMGLRPLNFFFNSLLVMTSILLAFILYHRFQLMEVFCGMHFPQFVLQVLQGMKNPSAVLNLQDPIYGLNCLNVGMWLMLVFLVIPIVVIAFFPLGILRHYAEERRDEKLQELGAQLEDVLADHKGNQADLAKNLDDRIKRLQDASLWPDSDRAALYYIGIVLVLAVAAWLPPFLVLIVVALGGILLDQFREILKSKLA